MQQGLRTIDVRDRDYFCARDLLGVAQPCTSGLNHGSAILDLNRGDVVDHCIGFVLRGTFGVRRTLADGRRSLCVIFKERDLVDLRRDERQRQGKLVALATSRFLAVEPACFEDCVETHLGGADALQRHHRELLARMRDHAADLVSKTPMERIASILFEFRRWPRVGEVDNGTLIIRLPINRLDIAEYIGLKPETVSRAIRQMESEGLISLPSAHTVAILDVPMLRQLANGGRPRRTTRRS